MSHLFIQHLGVQTWMHSAIYKCHLTHTFWTHAFPVSVLCTHLCVSLSGWCNHCGNSGKEVHAKPRLVWHDQEVCPTSVRLLFMKFDCLIQQLNTLQLSHCLNYTFPKLLIESSQKIVFFKYRHCPFYYWLRGSPWPNHCYKFSLTWLQCSRHLVLLCPIPIFLKFHSRLTHSSSSLPCWEDCPHTLYM